METEGTTKAPKDKCCPYCGQAFTSSSLGRHLDLYIKEKNPKAPDGLHNVDEIRKLRGGITRRQPRGGATRDSSHPRDSQAGSKRGSTASDADSIMTRSPGTPKKFSSISQFNRTINPRLPTMTNTSSRQTSLVILKTYGNKGIDITRSRSNSQRFFNKKIMKSSLEVKQRVQDAIDTARAAELALREVMASLKAAKQQINTKKMPFDFNPLSMDFPALCLQCLESPPTLFSSTPHSTATSWSISPPGEKQNEALKTYFQEEFRKWKIICSSTTSTQSDALASHPPQKASQQEGNPDYMPHLALESARKLDSQVDEHLEESFKVWEQLSQQRRQELWALEMARTIGKRQQEVVNLKGVQYSLKQENANLKTQIDNLNKQQQPREFKIVPPMTLRLDEKTAELWNDPGNSSRQSTGTNHEERQDLNAMVSEAIERWKNVIATSRAANAVKAQRSLEQVSASLRTPRSATQPLSPEESRPAQQFLYRRAEQSYCQPESSPNAQPRAGQDVSTISINRVTTTTSESKTSAANTPTQSADESDEDIDADGDDDDADADVEMEGGGDYLSAANTPIQHTVPQLPQHSISQHHQMLPVTRAHDQHISAVRHSSYSQRESPYGHHGVLPSQQIHMTQQSFGHQLQTLEHNLAHGHNLGWNHDH